VLERLLTDRDALVREIAARAWPRAGGGTGPLERALDDPEERVRTAAAASLESMGWRPEDVDRAVRFAVLLDRAEAAAAHGPRAVPALLRELWDSAGRLRPAAAEGLARLGDPRAVEPLIEGLVRTSGEDRAVLADALGRIADVRAVAPLQRLLTDEQFRVRTAGARALGAIADPASLPPLLAALVDDSDETRWAVATALGEIGDARAAGPLLAMAEDRYVGEAVVRSLGKILERSAASVGEEQLRAMARLGEVFQLTYNESGWGETRPVDASGVRRAAREELARRER
jgi:HEAT repeat protein